MLVGCRHGLPGVGVGGDQVLDAQRGHGDIQRHAEGGEGGQECQLALLRAHTGQHQWRGLLCQREVCRARQAVQSSGKLGVVGRFSRGALPGDCPYLLRIDQMVSQAARPQQRVQQSLIAFGLGLLSRPDTAQVVIDLYVMAVLACVWMVRDTRTRGGSMGGVLPYLLVTVVFVSLGPLLYIVVRGVAGEGRR